MKDRAQSHIGFVRPVFPIELRHQIIEPNVSFLDSVAEDIAASFSPSFIKRNFMAKYGSGFHWVLLVRRAWKPDSSNLQFQCRQNLVCMVLAIAGFIISDKTSRQPSQI